MYNSCVLLRAGRLPEVPSSGTLHLDHFSRKSGYTQQREKVELGRLRELPEVTLQFTLN